MDHLGRIESMNRTAERFFGVRQSDVMSDLLDTLIPDIAPKRRRRPRARGPRDRAGDDALRPRRARGGRQAPPRRADAGRDPGQRDAEQAPADLHRLHPRHGRALEGRGGAQGQRGALPRAGRERARRRSSCSTSRSSRFVDCNDNAADFFKMSREDLLRVGPEQVSPPEQADGTPSFGVARGHIESALGRRDAGLRVAAQGRRRQG